MRKRSASSLRWRHARHRRRERRLHCVIELADVRSPRRCRGRDENLRQRQPPQKRISRLPRRTDQDPPVLRQPVVIPQEIRLRLREGKVIIVGIAQIAGALVFRDSVFEIERVRGQAFPARVLADGLVEGFVVLLDHGEDILRSDQSSKAKTKTRGTKKLAASGQLHCPAIKDSSEAAIPCRLSPNQPSHQLFLSCDPRCPPPEVAPRICPCLPRLSNKRPKSA